MAELANRSMSSLSGGERQRASIAAALAQGGSILLLDEPTSFLDYRHQVQILDLLDRLHHESALTIVAVTHDLNSTVASSDAVIALKDGRVAATGKPGRASGCRNSGGDLRRRLPADRGRPSGSSAGVCRRGTANENLAASRRARRVGPACPRHPAPGGTTRAAVVSPVRFSRALIRRGSSSGRSGCRERWPPLSAAPAWRSAAPCFRRSFATRWRLPTPSVSPAVPRSVWRWPVVSVCRWWWLVSPRPRWRPLPVRWSRSGWCGC